MKIFHNTVYRHGRVPVFATRSIIVTPFEVVVWWPVEHQLRVVGRDGQPLSTTQLEESATVHDAMRVALEIVRAYYEARRP